MGSPSLLMAVSSESCDLSTSALAISPQWVSLGWFVGWLVGWLAGWLIGWRKWTLHTRVLESDLGKILQTSWFSAIRLYHPLKLSSKWSPATPTSIMTASFPQYSKLHKIASFLLGRAGLNNVFLFWATQLGYGHGKDHPFILETYLPFRGNFQMFSRHPTHGIQKKRHKAGTQTTGSSDSLERPHWRCRRLPQHPWRQFHRCLSAWRCVGTLFDEVIETRSLSKQENFYDDLNKTSLWKLGMSLLSIYLETADGRQLILVLQHQQSGMIITPSVRNQNIPRRCLLALAEGPSELSPPPESSKRSWSSCEVWVSRCFDVEINRYCQCSRDMGAMWSMTNE